MADTVEIDIIARVDQAVSGIQSFITKIAAAYVSVEAFKRLIVDSFKSYEEAENSQARLGLALRATGQYSKEALDSLLDYSSVLQKTTTYSDEATQGAATFLMSIGRLSVEGVKAIMPSLMDFATAMGQDLVTSARQLSMAIDGGRNSLGRYKLDLKDITDPTERFDAIIKQLSKDFPGFAQEMAKTTSGQLTIFKNQVDDAKESVGGLLAYFVRGYMDWGSNFVGSLKQVTSALSGVWNVWRDITNLKNPFAPGSVTYEEVNKFNNQASFALYQGSSVKPKAKPFVGGTGAGGEDLASLNAIVELHKSSFGWIQNEIEGTQALVDLQNQLKDAQDIWFTNSAEGYAAMNTAAKEYIGEQGQIHKANIITAEDWGKISSATVPLLKKQSQDMADMWETIANAAAQFGSALAKGDAAGALSGIIRMMGQILIAAGARLIAEGGLAMLGPGLALMAAGGFAIIGGSAITGSSKSSRGSSLPHMAEGGIAFGPTLALIGESGPEAVVPLGRGAGGTTINVYGSVWSERDLASVVAASARHW